MDIEKELNELIKEIEYGENGTYVHDHWLLSILLEMQKEIDSLKSQIRSLIGQNGGGCF